MLRQLLCALFVIGLARSASAETADEALARIRTQVLQNEKAAEVIRLKFTVTYDRPDYDDEEARKAAPKAVRPGGRLKVGARKYARTEGTWAQNKSKLFAEVEHFYEDGPAAGGQIFVIADGVIRSALKSKPRDVRRARKMLWYYGVPPVTLGVRPFEGEQLLSETLVPEFARLRPETEKIDGKVAAVIDVKRPLEPAYFARMWVDAERGTPIRIHYFDNPASDPEPRLCQTIEKLEWRQLPTGGWFPVAGERTVIGLDGPISVEKIVVDQKSITTKREDIPDKQFVLEATGGEGL